MAKMIVIDALHKVVRLEHSVSNKMIATILGAGSKSVFSLPNGDRLKINSDSVDQASFTIGGSNSFRGNAVVITKSSVNCSNMALLVTAIRQMVIFQTNDCNSDGGAVRRVAQLEFWPPKITDDGVLKSAGG